LSAVMQSGPLPSGLGGRQAAPLEIHSGRNSHYRDVPSDLQRPATWSLRYFWRVRSAAYARWQSVASASDDAIAWGGSGYQPRYARSVKLRTMVERGQSPWSTARTE
jgi:hypothetical protein